MLETIERYLALSPVQAGLRAGAIVLGALMIARLLSRRLHRMVEDPQQSLLLRRILSAIILGVGITWALSELGLELGVVLGAAGVLTVAIGFAAQTSMSNLISGLFLMGERPFRIGDFIKVDNTFGEVTSIDLLSIKLATIDNLLVRIPNETVLKSQVVNYTHFDIRRCDVAVGVSYASDLASARRILLRVAESDPRCLQDPEPQVLVTGFGESAVNVVLMVWARNLEFLAFKSDIHAAVKEALAGSGIEIALPQRVVHMRSPAP